MATTLSLAAYRPRHVPEAQLVAHFREEIGLLRAHGHITSRPAPICRTPRGEYIVLIEWATPTAVDEAHQDGEVMAVWARKAALVEYISPRELDGSDVPFIRYEVVADL